MTLSSDYFKRSLKVAPGGVHSPVRGFKGVGGTPLFFSRAQGAHLFSVEGKRYIDFCQSFGPLLLGHRDPDVVEAVREVEKMAWTFGACDPYSLELAEWLVNEVNWLEKVRFVCSGTEAVMSALRLARAATGRDKILKFEGCYHGHVDSMLVKAGSGLAGASALDSLGVSPAVASQTLVAPLDDEETFDEILSRFGDEIAAVIIEPLPANYGLLIQRKEFLHRIAQGAKKIGALLILDEVISGFRVALGGMAQLLNIEPDLVTYGKIIGGGFPVGCFGGRADLMDLMAPQGSVYQAGTLAANPIGMRAGLATLQKAKALDLYGVLETKCEYFSLEIERMSKAAHLPLRVAHFGSIFWIHFSQNQEIRSIRNIAPDHRERFSKLFHSLLEQGIYLAPSGYEVGFLSWAHDELILSDTLHRMGRCFEKLA